MSDGSHMVGGRTYRTTNEVKLKKPGEPGKLTVLTTAKIPGPTAQPPTVGIDPSKMITTHDEPEERDVEDMSKDEPAIMTESETEKESPNPLVQPPEPIVVNEGWDEPRKKKRKKSSRSKKEKKVE